MHTAFIFAQGMWGDPIVKLVRIREACGHDLVKGAEGIGRRSHT